MFAAGSGDDTASVWLIDKEQQPFFEIKGLTIIGKIFLLFETFILTYRSKGNGGSYWI